jgi:hypothetical protein
MLYSRVPAFLGYCIWILLCLPLSPSSLFLCHAPPLLYPDHVRRPCRSSTPLHPCTCRPGLCPAIPWPRAGSTSPRHVARRLPELRLTAARRRSVSHTTSCLPTSPRATHCLAAALPTLCCLAPRSPRRIASARAPPQSSRAPPRRRLLLLLSHVVILIPSMSWSL